MRPPRYQFPNEVRETTRAMASRMVGDGTIAQTPEELDAWIARSPDAREPLAHGGYGREFTADDLFPLFQVFVTQAGGPAPTPDAPPRPSGRPFLIAMALAAIVILVVIVVVLM